MTVDQITPGCMAHADHPSGNPMPMTVDQITTEALA